MLDVEASGWKGREGTAVKLVPEARTFYQRVSPRLADAGKLRVFLNRRDGRILAFKLCALHGGRLSSLKIGYLDAYAKESPGQVLRYWTIRWAFAQPDVSMFDMLAPASEDKLRFATDVERLHTLYLFHPGVKGTAAWLRWSLVPRLRARWRRQRERGTRASS